MGMKLQTAFIVAIKNSQQVIADTNSLHSDECYRNSILDGGSIALEATFKEVMILGPQLRT